ALKILEAIVAESEKQRQEVAYLLGWCYVLHKRWADAANVLSPLSPFSDDEVESENRMDRERLALCYLRLGYAAVQFTRYEEATRHFSRCIKLLNDKRVKLTPLVRVKAHYSLATSYLMRGLYPAAVQQYHEALHHFLYIDDDEEWGNIYYGLSETYRNMGNLDDAQLAGERALQLYEKAGKFAREGVTRNLLGQIALDNKNYREASDHFTQALAIGNAHAGPMMAMMNCAALAEVRLAEDRLDEAKRFCQLACDMVAQVKNAYFCSQTYLTTAKVAHAAALQTENDERRRLLEETISWLEKAKDALAESEAHVNAADIYQLWAQTLEELGQYQEAFAFWRSGYETLSRAKGAAWY
ncbi:MAG TPA: tetratricopeptide repeat protein, partial [Ktedonobacteraceae bacterium]|nr:tetratricopeptide repeat protein [Ktedonobacteraceae bacterium]